MSQANVDTVLEMVDGWNSGDVERWLKPLHPEVEWSSAIARQVEGSEAAAYSGLAELRRFWDEWHELWDLSIDITETRDLGETVLALGRMHTRGTVSGIDLERPVGYLVEFDSGLIRRANA